jgi:polysaccharide pyruvyl transferase WcaK-like protein
MMLSGTEKSRQKSSVKGNATIRKIGLMGCWGFGNMGNLAHQIAMIQHIRKYQPNAQISGFAVYPEITQKIHGIPCFPFMRYPKNGWWEGNKESYLTNSLYRLSNNIRKATNPITRRLLTPIRVLIELALEVLALVRAFRTLKGFDMLIITGGGHFDDVYGGAITLPYALFAWSLIAKLQKFKFLVVSNGVGPIHQPLSKFFFKQVLSSASYRSYRDTYSKEYAEKVLNFRRKEDRVYPDLAHSLDVARYQTAPRLGSEQKTVVGIAPIPHTHEGAHPGVPGDYTPTYLNYLEKLSNFVIWLLENQYIIYFFVSDEGTDKRSIEDLKDTLSKKKVNYSTWQIIQQRPPLSEKSSFDDFMTQLAETDLVIASRFHGVLLSQLLNKPTLALSFGKKTDCLMADAGQTEYCLSIDQFDVETMKERFIALEASQEIIKKQLEQRTHQYREALDEQYVQLFGDLDSKIQA